MIFDKEPITRVCYREIANLDPLMGEAEPKNRFAAKLAPARDAGWWKQLRLSTQLKPTSQAGWELLLAQVHAIMRANRSELHTLARADLTKLSSAIWKASFLDSSPDNTVLCARCLSLAVGLPTDEKTRQCAPIDPADRPAIMKRIISDYLVKLLVDNSVASSSYDHFAFANPPPKGRRTRSTTWTATCGS
jgi:hypothetical protein